MNLESLEDGSFDHATISSELPAVVLFWAPWSKPCHTAKEVLEELARYYDSKIKFFAMNVDENANIPATLGIHSIPCLTSIDNGQVKENLFGRHPKIRIREFIEKISHDGSSSP